MWSLTQDQYAWRDGEQIIRNVAWVGCGASGKTFDSALFALGWYLCDPTNSTVVLTTTEKSAIRMRVWPDLVALNSEAYDPDNQKHVKLFNVQDQELRMGYKKHDDRHAINAKAVKHGETQKAIEFIKGLHANRMLLIVDEATGTPEAIFHVIHNWAKGCKDLTVLSIANAASHLDPHGRICEPEVGWDNITVEDEWWRTKGVAEFNLPPGICMHFDGFKSPNVIARKERYPFLYAYGDYKKAQQAGRTDSINFWAFDRGFWVPQGVFNSVMSDLLVEKYGGFDRPAFYSKANPVAALDPAFGGNRCILRFGKIGDLSDGRQALVLGEKLEIEPQASSRDPLDAQIATRTIEECKSRGVDPAYFAVDSTGTGRGVASHLVQQWSSEIHQIEFGGKPSDKVASEDDNRPAHEVYDRRVTELWYSSRSLLMAGQLKGLDRESVIELSSREIEYKNKKLKLDTKEECKDKIGRSPDDADAIALLVELSRRHGVTPGRIAGPNRKEPRWDEIAKEKHEIFAGIQMEGEMVI